VANRETYYGLFAPLEFTEIIASLKDKPRKKIVDKCANLFLDIQAHFCILRLVESKFLSFRFQDLPLVLNQLFDFENDLSVEKYAKTGYLRFHSVIQR